jgi:hypothetical protein
VSGWKVRWMEGGTMLVLLGVEWWPEPAEQPADRTTLQQYDVDEFVLARWRKRARSTSTRGRC